MARARQVHVGRYHRRHGLPGQGTLELHGPGAAGIAGDSHVAGPYGDQRLQSGLNVRSGGVVRDVHRRLGTQGEGEVAARGRVDGHGLLGIGGG